LHFCCLLRRLRPHKERINSDKPAPRMYFGFAEPTYLTSIALQLA
jgi:hypothetical protein